MRYPQLALALCVAAACSDPPSGSHDAAVPPPADAAVPDAPPPIPDAAPAPDAFAGMAPDLTVNPLRLRADLAVEQKEFGGDACELTPADACIAEPGVRTLLRFAVETPNIGNADLELGNPFGNPEFEYSSCHEHYHFTGYASYTLIDGEGNEVAFGHKQAFCLLDSSKWIDDDPTVADSSKYHCGFQGIQRGWSDVYSAYLDCQWIDVTDTPPGDYTLVVELNSEHKVIELDYENNRYELPITLGDPDLSTPTEACDADLDAHAVDGLHRECSWDSAGTWECTPGAELRIGCSAACSGLGSCTGNPMIRVCDAADPSGNCTASNNLDDNEDSCGSLCPRARNITCPTSGQLAVFTAPHTPGAPYTCDIQLAYD